MLAKEEDCRVWPEVAATIMALPVTDTLFVYRKLFLAGSPERQRNQQACYCDQANAGRDDWGPSHLISNSEIQQVDAQAR